MRWKTLWNKLLYPPIWLIVVLTVFSIVALLVILLNGWGRYPLACVCYVPAAYAVTTLTAAGIVAFPSGFRNAKQRIYSYPLGNRLMTDARLQTKVRLHISLTTNLLFAAAHIIAGWWYRTAWFIVLAGYYTVLAVMRFLLLRFVRRNILGDSLYKELRRSRTCAWVLLLLNLVLTAIVLMILFQNKGHKYHGMLIYVVAVYTFYMTITAVIDIARSKRYHSPVIAMTKVIKLAAALVSVLAMETAMLTQFSKEGSVAFRQIMVSVTGGAIALIVTALSVGILVRTGREIRKLAKEKIHE